MIFEIPYPPTKRGKAAWNKRFGLNAYYAGKHWSQRKRDAEELHSLALWSMKRHISENSSSKALSKSFFAGTMAWTWTITPPWARHF